MNILNNTVTIVIIIAKEGHALLINITIVPDGSGLPKPARKKGVGRH